MACVDQVLWFLGWVSWASRRTDCVNSCSGCGESWFSLWAWRQWAVMEADRKKSKWHLVRHLLPVRSAHCLQIPVTGGYFCWSWTLLGICGIKVSVLIHATPPSQSPMLFQAEPDFDRRFVKATHSVSFGSMGTLTISCWAWLLAVGPEAAGDESLLKSCHKALVAFTQSYVGCELLEAYHFLFFARFLMLLLKASLFYISYNCHCQHTIKYCVPLSSSISPSTCTSPPNNPRWKL